MDDEDDDGDGNGDYNQMQRQQKLTKNIDNGIIDDTIQSLKSCKYYYYFKNKK